MKMHSTRLGLSAKTAIKEKQTGKLLTPMWMRYSGPIRQHFEKHLEGKSAGAYQMKIADSARLRSLEESKRDGAR
jgi:hypothetical protein